MNKDTIKVLIAEYQQRVLDVSFVERPYVMEENLNYVFVGLRRVGKSYLMFQHIHHLINAGHVREEILYFNFEDDRIASLQTEDLDLIKVCYEEMFDHKPIFFLDEILFLSHRLTHTLQKLLHYLLRVYLLMRTLWLNKQPNQPRTLLP